MEQLEDLIEERNAAAKNAEEELIIFIQNRPVLKNNKKFNTKNVVGSIDYIETMTTNNSKYPNLLRWKQLHKNLQSFIDNLPNNNTNNNYYNKNSIIAEGRDYGFDVNDIRSKLPQRRFLNRFPKLPKIFTKKNTAKSYLPTQQNPQQNLSVRPAEVVQPVPTATPSKSSWWPFGGGRKTNRKPSGSRGGDLSGKSITEYSLALAKLNLNNAKREFLSIQKLYRNNPNNRMIEDKMATAASKKALAEDNLEKAEQNNQEARSISLGRPLNNAAREAREAPRRSSWFSLGRGGRKTHHKKRHMRKGSRKIHRK